MYGSFIPAPLVYSTTQSCKSDFTQRALHLGRMIKHNEKRSWSIVRALNMPLAVQDKLILRYINLKFIMEEALELTLPPNTEYACANGFDDTTITHVFYTKCTYHNCICNNDDYKFKDNEDYSFLRDRGSSRRNNNLTWAQLEALLFVLEMHTNIVTMSERFSESVFQKCKAERTKFSRKSVFGGEILNKKRLQSTISKQRRLQETMLKAIHSVSSRARVLWAKVRRWVRMHHYAHMLWEYKFSSCTALLDIQAGTIMLQNIFSRN